MGTRTGAQRPASGPGIGPAEAPVSGSEQDSDSGDDEDAVESGGTGRRERRDKVARGRAPSGAFGGAGSGPVGAKPGKKTRGRVKIKMEFIDNKLRRYTTFSKRKTGIMKKAYELSTLTGTQVLLLVASETGHVYTFATRKLQPMITSETGKALIQTCLNSPDSPPRCDPSSDQRMSATGFEETDLTYQVTEADGGPEPAKGQTSSPPSTNGSLMKSPPSVLLSGGITLMSGTHTIPLSQLQGQAMAIQGPPAPTAALQAPPVQQATLLRLPTSVSLSGSGAAQQLQTIQVQPSSQQVSTNQNSSDVHSPASSKGLSLPVSVVSSSSSSSSSVAGHMMYPGSHTVMYTTPPSSLGDGSSLAVLNAFPAAGHSQSQDPAVVPQVFLTSLSSVAAQIPVSAVQLHPMVISQQSSSSLTELQVVSLDAHQSRED
ncbi:serum response factor isoform X2 [Oryzias melastigma]|uniref:serum response factor isoform X2 n=1 Tax=Oryzias melastigma TaxID=30732 RepID=UPI000CF7E49D|nr:serum response factor isoform X2 [Oryzias melastigma]